MILLILVFGSPFLVMVGAGYLAYWLALQEAWWAWAFIPTILLGFVVMVAITELLIADDSEKMGGP